MPTLHHPTFGAKTFTERQARVYRNNGWSDVDPNKVSKTDLVEIAEDQGVDTSDKTKAEIIQELD